jgi:uncharacterized protein (TIGR00369 family)
VSARATAGFADAPAGADNPLLEVLGIRLVDADTGRAVFEIDVDARHLNRQRSLQGGVVATMLDAACGYAGLCGHERRAAGHAVTVSLAISYLARVREGRLQAVGQVTRMGRSVYFSSGELRGPAGELVATAQGAFKRTAAPAED